MTVRAIRIPNTLGLGNAEYRAKVLARLMGGIEVDQPSRCWIWSRASNVHGYGALFFRGRPRDAHWVSWVLLVEPAHAGTQLVHLCHTAACPPQGVCRHLRCVNPRHLALAA